MILAKGKKAGGLWRYGLLLALVAGCADGEWLRQFLPKGAQDAALVFARKTNFTMPSCSVAAYRPLAAIELGPAFLRGPIEDAFGEMSMVNRIIGVAAEGCASPATFGFSTGGYYDFLSDASIRYKWAGGHEVVIFAPETGLFWVLTAGT